MEDRRGGVAVTAERFVQLVQFAHHGSLVLVLPQDPIPDQPAVVIQGAAEATAGLCRRLTPGFRRVVFS